MNTKQNKEEMLQNKFMDFWDSKKESLGLGKYSDVITDWWIKEITKAKSEGYRAIQTLDSIDSLPDMIHPKTDADYKKLWIMIQKRIDAFKEIITKDK